MDIYQLKTFIAVAREGSITRAAEQVHLSQPAVSAHIKALEDTLGLTLFSRTPRGMSLTRDGQRLLSKAEQTLAVHQELMDEATRIKGKLTGKLRLGASSSAGSSSGHAAIGRLLTRLAERSPDVEVVLRHGTSAEILAGLRGGSLDAGFYNEAGEPEPDLTTVEVSQFQIYVASSPGLDVQTAPLDMPALAALPWIYPTASACCGRTAERLFQQHKIRPKRIISVDREDVTRALIAGGLGVGLLHAGLAQTAEARGEVVLLMPAHNRVRVLFAQLASRAQDPLLAAAMAMVTADRPA